MLLFVAFIVCICGCFALCFNLSLLFEVTCCWFVAG